MKSFMQMSDGQRLRMDWERVVVGNGNGTDCQIGFVRLRFLRRCEASPIMPAGEEECVFLLDGAEVRELCHEIQLAMGRK